MATVMRMPEVLANATEAVIQTWLVTVGQEIAVGDPIAEIETDKAVVEYAAEVEGVLARLIAEPGATIAVGQPIALVAAPGETVDDNGDIDAGVRDPESGAPVIEKIASDAPAPVPPETPVASPEAADGRRLFATPLVRKIARERGIDLSTLTGSGPGGRIVRRDLDRLPPVESAPEPAEAVPSAQAVSPQSDSTAFTDIPLTGMRRAIARRLTESKTTVPHFYVTADCRVDALLELRRNVNAAGVITVSLNDFVLKAVAAAMIEVPEANAIWNGDSVRRFHAADIAVAVAVDGGLLTPVLRGVDRLSLSAVATQVADLAGRARDGKIKQTELEGGSFSVSNLGMFGVTEFSAILNPPHSGILAVGRAVQKPVVVAGELAVGSVMTVTLSADHRVIDGAVAAQWLAAFVRRVENPLTILI
ncbi:2-oxo acid dehydrogenase subunit E2 [Mycolicibacterium sp. 3033]|nr:2-oxo acid dehydrogenase subunit E2 [Mycolicibacterium aurantiacum]